jgi:hypothetical protein
MIAIAKRSIHRRPADWQRRFLEILPAIQRQARFAFRKLNPEEREEALADVAAQAFCGYCLMVDSGKQSLAFPTPLARFAIARYRAGRRAGTKRNVRDISSPYAQAVKGIVLERLDQFDSREGQWREVLVEDRKSGPAETAAARIDVAAWLKSLSRRKRKIAETLARGETTSAAASLFGLTAGRVSQLRKELQRNWNTFQGESVAAS